MHRGVQSKWHHKLTGQSNNCNFVWVQIQTYNLIQDVEHQEVSPWKNTTVHMHVFKCWGIKVCGGGGDKISLGGIFGGYTGVASG